MKRFAEIVITFILFTSLFFCPVHADFQSAPKDSNISVDIPFKTSSPSIDGMISEGEYGKLEIPSSSLSFITGSQDDWAKAKSFKFDAYACYDEEYFYLAVVYNQSESERAAYCRDKDMWAQSCLMVSLAPSGSVGRVALETGFRLDGYGKQSAYIWNKNNNNSYTPDGNFAVVMADSVFTYEIRVPFSAFGSAGADNFALCFSISTGNYFNDGRYSYIQFGQGISGFSTQSDADAGKNTAIFPTAVLSCTGETDIPETDVVTEEPKQPLPDTGDSYLIFYALIIIPLSVLFAYPMIRKKA